MQWRLFALIGIGVLSPMSGAGAQEGLSRIDTLVVIYAENRSFDHLYGLFPGAEGIDRATPEQRTQLDHDGTPLPYLTIFALDGKPDGRFPRMPNGPFRIDAPPLNVPIDTITPSPIHVFYHTRSRSTVAATTCSPRCRRSAVG